MSDIADTASETISLTTDAAISIVLKAKYEEGQPGDCCLCGYTYARVVPRTFEGEPVKSCGGCRDLYRLG